MRLTLCVAVCLVLLAAGSVDASKRRSGSRSSKSFDFYLLTMSYAPDFCDQGGSNKDPQECGKGRNIGYVVHGLWPQAETGRGPERCGGSPVSGSIVQLMLKYMPSASLIQHEWSTHGTCTGLSASDYFAQVRKARDGVTIPADLAQPTASLSLSSSQVDGKFAVANPSYAKGAFRTSCYSNAELQEVRVCLTKDLTPRACPVSLTDCTQSPLTILPVR